MPVTRLTKYVEIELGGEGSGNFGHAGRLGEVGGSGAGVGILIEAGSKFGVNKKENIELAMGAIKKLGIDVRLVGSDLPKDIREGIKRKGSAFYWENPETKRNEIVVNQYNRSWENPKAYNREHGPEGDRFFSSDNPARSLIHEYAHAKFGDTPDAEHLFINDHSFRELVGKEVGTYASTSVREFIAEVYTGVSTGRSYSDFIMDQYNRFKEENIIYKKRIPIIDLEKTDEEANRLHSSKVHKADQFNSNHLTKYR